MPRVLHFSAVHFLFAFMLHLPKSFNELVECVACETFLATMYCFVCKLLLFLLLLLLLLYNFISAGVVFVSEMIIPTVEDLVCR